MSEKNISISLTPDELYAAVAVAGHRRITSIFKRSQAQHYQCPNNTEWSTEIEAAAAEMVFAKFKNWYWSGSQWSGKVAKADVGNVQVRHTHHTNGCLIIYPEDDDIPRYVLVTGRSPNYVIVGWMLGKDGKQNEFFKSDARYPAWFVPQLFLKGFSSKNEQPT